MGRLILTNDVNTASGLMLRAGREFDDRSPDVEVVRGLGGVLVQATPDLEHRAADLRAQQARGRRGAELGKLQAPHLGDTKPSVGIEPHGDGSIVMTDHGLRVGVIADDQHGSLAGGNLHAEASEHQPGFMTPSDKARIRELEERVAMLERAMLRRGDG